MIARVAELLRLCGADEAKSFRVRIEASGHLAAIGLDLKVPRWPAAAEAEEAPRGLWLSPLEQRVVDYLAGRATWATGEAIATAIGEQYQHRLKAILTNLADRQIIEPQTGLGYRLRS